MMGLDSYQIGNSIYEASETGNFFFTQIFALEAIVQVCVISAVWVWLSILKTYSLRSKCTLKNYLT